MGDTTKKPAQSSGHQNVKKWMPSFWNPAVIAPMDSDKERPNVTHLGDVAAGGSGLVNCALALAEEHIAPLQHACRMRSTQTASVHIVIQGIL